MKSGKPILSWFFVLLLFCWSMNAQQTSSLSGSATVPRLVNFSSKATDIQGKLISGIAGATFAIYKEETGGSPLWLETQNIQADAKGNYSVRLGATKPDGLPLDLFSSGEARWLAVTINGGEEQPRALLVSVPYALKAADAETLGGKPLSAFQLVAPRSNNGRAQTAQPAVDQANEIRCTGGTACKTGFVPLFASNGGSAKVSDSIIKQSGREIDIAGSEGLTGNLGVAGNLSAGPVTASLLAASGTITGSTVGVGTTSPATRLDVFSTSNTNGPIGQFGSSGMNDSNSVKIYNGSGITETFQVGCISCFVPGTQVGDAGLRASPGKNIAFGDSGASRLMLDSTGNALQSTRTGGGMVKAMVLVDQNGVGICFNSTLIGAPATTPPCGFAFHGWGPGDYTIDFGFQVDDRFVSTTAGGAGNKEGQLRTAMACVLGLEGSFCNNKITANQVEVTSIFGSNGNFGDNPTYVIVY
jgi:hypothetical protein